jgi:hypothetical protein
MTTPEEHIAAGAAALQRLIEEHPGQHVVAFSSMHVEGGDEDGSVLGVEETHQ